jgi:hypothetical protein
LDDYWAAAMPATHRRRQPNGLIALSHPEGFVFHAMSTPQARQQLKAIKRRPMNRRAAEQPDNGGSEPNMTVWNSGKRDHALRAM